jgi:hypothetical protein
MVGILNFNWLPKHRMEGILEALTISSPSYAIIFSFFSNHQIGLGLGASMLRSQTSKAGVAQSKALSGGRVQ